MKLMVYSVKESLLLLPYFNDGVFGVVRVKGTPCDVSSHNARTSLSAFFKFKINKTGNQERDYVQQESTAQKAG